MRIPRRSFPIQPAFAKRSRERLVPPFRAPHAHRVTLAFSRHRERDRSGKNHQCISVRISRALRSRVRMVVRTLAAMVACCGATRHASPNDASTSLSGRTRTATRTLSCSVRGRSFGIDVGGRSRAWVSEGLVKKAIRVPVVARASRSRFTDSCVRSDR